MCLWRQWKTIYLLSFFCNYSNGGVLQYYTVFHYKPFTFAGPNQIFFKRIISYGLRIRSTPGILFCTRINGAVKLQKLNYVSEMYTINSFFCKRYAGSIKPCGIYLRPIIAYQIKKIIFLIIINP